MNNVSKAGIVIKPHALSVEGILKIVVEYFEGRGIEGVLEGVAARKLGRPDGLPRPDVAAASDLVVVLGGDGTMLSVAHHAAQAGVPVMGVNLGRLGFLTEIPVSETTLTLDRFLAGDGGPIVPPPVPAFVLTPICPHTLSFRPLAVPSTSTVGVRLLTGGEEVHLTLDGQRGGALVRDATAEIRKAP